MNAPKKKYLQFCIYLLQEDDGRLREGVLPRCKIGMTNNIDISFNQGRMQIIRSCSPEKLLLRHTIDVPSREVAKEFEGTLHALFWKKRSFEYYSEWFDLDEEDIEWLCSLSFESLKNFVYGDRRWHLNGRTEI